MLGCNLKKDRMISIHFQGKPFSIIVIQVYASTANAEEAETEWFYEDLHDLLGLTPKKDVLFIIGDWNTKVESQELPKVRTNLVFKYKMKQGKANRVLSKEHVDHSKHPFPTTKETNLHIDIIRWPIPKSDWLCSLQLKMEKLYTISKNKTCSWRWFRSSTPYCRIQA